MHIRIYCRASRAVCAVTCVCVAWTSCIAAGFGRSRHPLRSPSIEQHLHIWVVNSRIHVMYKLFSTNWQDSQYIVHICIDKKMINRAPTKSCSNQQSHIIKYEFFNYYYAKLLLLLLLYKKRVLLFWCKNINGESCSKQQLIIDWYLKKIILLLLFRQISQILYKYVASRFFIFNWMFRSPFLISSTKYSLEARVRALFMSTL